MSHPLLTQRDWVLDGGNLRGQYTFNIALSIVRIQIQSEKQVADRGTVLTGALIDGSEGALIGMAASKAKEICALVELDGNRQFLAIMRDESFHKLLAMTVGNEREGAKTRQARIQLQPEFEKQEKELEELAKAEINALPAKELKLFKEFERAEKIGNAGMLATVLLPCLAIIYNTFLASMEERGLCRIENRSGIWIFVVLLEAFLILLVNMKPWVKSTHKQGEAIVIGVKSFAG